MANNHLNPAKRDTVFAFLEGTGDAFIGQFKLDRDDPGESKVHVHPYSVSVTVVIPLKFRFQGVVGESTT